MSLKKTYSKEFAYRTYNTLILNPIKSYSGKEVERGCLSVYGEMKQILIVLESK